MRARLKKSRVKPGATVRHRLAALSSLFEYLCEKNAVTHNPVKGVKRPMAESGEGKTPALGDHQARELLAALASLFDYLCEQNAVTHNPVKGVERPRTESGEGKTPASP